MTYQQYTATKEVLLQDRATASAMRTPSWSSSEIRSWNLMTSGSSMGFLLSRDCGLMLFTSVIVQFEIQSAGGMLSNRQRSRDRQREGKSFSFNDQRRTHANFLLLRRSRKNPRFRASPLQKVPVFRAQTGGSLQLTRTSELEWILSISCTRRHFRATSSHDIEHCWRMLKRATRCLLFQNKTKIIGKPVFVSLINFHFCFQYPNA